LKYEGVYLKDYEAVQEAKDGIKTYFGYYNNERTHQWLDYKTQAEVYFSGLLEQADLSKNKGHSTGLNQT
jgi:transposase InsO family protein